MAAHLVDHKRRMFFTTIKYRKKSSPRKSVTLRVTVDFVCCEMGTRSEVGPSIITSYYGVR